MPYVELAQEPYLLSRLVESESNQLRSFGQRIKHVLSNLSHVPISTVENCAGGRHDNDFMDFRQISILPTADELKSEEPPFLRTTEEISDSEMGPELSAVYLDNQFRLLREDMLAELREELQILFGKQKGRRKGFSIVGFAVFGVDCGKPEKREPWRLQLQCISDLGHFANIKPESRKSFLKEKCSILRHQSLACLLVDDSIVAFPTIHRDLDMLARKPSIVTLELKDAASALKALLKMKLSRNIKLMQIETGTFSYEPILEGLQTLRDFPLVNEILFWTPGAPITHVEQPPKRIIDRLEADSFSNLQDVLETQNSIILDESQAQSMLTGLKQRVSLVQGPPGT